jgi:phosphoglycolate phosphatase
MSLVTARTAIFDLDGTLADSAPDIAAALNAALIEGGHSPLDVATATTMVGAGARRLIERALTLRTGSPPTMAAVDALWPTFIAYYDAHPCVHARLYPGAREALDLLAADGWKLGVCTNKPEEIARAVIAALGIAPLFGAIVGGRDGVSLKPAPEMVHLALAELDATSSGAVFIGDSRADLLAGRAAGLPVILMEHGYNDVPVATLGADGLVAGFAGLIAEMERLGNRG